MFKLDTDTPINFTTNIIHMEQYNNTDYLLVYSDGNIT
jgi:hypothetical protein